MHITHFNNIRESSIKYFVFPVDGDTVILNLGNIFVIFFILCGDDFLRNIKLIMNSKTQSCDRCHKSINAYLTAREVHPKVIRKP